MSMRVLVVSVPSIGHARAMAPIARSLVSRGHEVHWAANEAVSYVRDAGVTLHSVLPDDLSEDRQRFPGTQSAEIDNWFLEEWFLPIAEQALRPTLEVACDIEPHLVVSDATALWGAMVAESIQRPWATYCPGLFMNSHERQLAIREIQYPQEPVTWSRKPSVGSSYWAAERRLNALRHGVGLASEASLNRVSDELVLCFTTRAVELDGAGLPPQARCVGPVFGSAADLDPFPRGAPELPPGDEPLILVSLGRVYSQVTGLLDSIIEAVEALDVRVIVAPTGTGRPTIDTSRIRFAHQPLSQAVVLDHAAVMVGSGGFNTVHEALCHGVPVLTLPVAGDEPALAARIHELGLGISLGSSHRSPMAIREAVQRVLADETFRQRAREFATESRLANGVSRSVRLLETLGTRASIEQSEEAILLEQLPRYPVRAPRFTLLARGDGISLASYLEQMDIEDPASAQAVRWLWDAVDGATRLEELLERWRGGANLLRILGGLVQRGILEENMGSPRLDADTRDRYREQITLFSHASTGGPSSHVNMRGNEFQERLVAAKVAVIGAGVLGSNVVRNLCLAGFGDVLLLGNGEVDNTVVARGGWFAPQRVGEARTAALAEQAQELRADLTIRTGNLPDMKQPSDGEHAETLADLHLIIVALDEFDRTLYGWVDEVCLVNSVQWTSVRRSRMNIELGPTVIPRQTACFRCYELRRAGNEPEEVGMGQTYAGSFQFQAGPEWVALEAVKLLSGFGEAVTIGRIVSFNPLTLRLSPHRVLRIPSCPRCGVDPALPPVVPWRPLAVR